MRVLPERPANGIARPAGFTLVEVLVAVVLLGLVGTVLYRTLVTGQRVHAAHVQEAALGETLRAALAILSAEVRELSAGDGDIQGMDSSGVTYNSMQAFHVLCAAPDTARGVVLLEDGAAPAPQDSLLVYAEGDPATRLDDGWVTAAASQVTRGAVCPAGQPGVALTLAGLPAAGLGAVRDGAPVRSFRPAQLLVYQDAGRDWWLGQRLFQPASGAWSTVQPVLGPLAPAGLSLAFLDRAGHAVTDPRAVARIRVRVRGRSPAPVRGAAGAAYVVREGATEVALRNNPRP
jgi:prepilin-type N-terminal cleavage/methylation domain-containing protein